MTLLAIMWGCASDKPSDEPTVEQTDTGALADESRGEASGDATPDGAQESGTYRPTLKQAQAAVFEIASEVYPGAPWTSVMVNGIGLDASGVWWVQAWTSTEREGDESEQWFVTYDGSSWKCRNSGTGMEREDYPSDIVWWDVE